ncbi:hypothetical protein C7M84_013449 [Penaeus vannamei]|uniref:Uncharacterized protein n=1 Tax=Penaeus vannamei TaxID=6689 RepID=A0A3R7LZ13_PENVA|nr:hypothetical protein C7M84_013449 [Penaeus vannamei]
MATQAITRSRRALYCHHYIRDKSFRKQHETTPKQTLTDGTRGLNSQSPTLYIPILRVISHCLIILLLLYTPPSQERLSLLPRPDPHPASLARAPYQSALIRSTADITRDLVCKVSPESFPTPPQASPSLPPQILALSTHCPLSPPKSLPLTLSPPYLPYPPTAHSPLSLAPPPSLLLPPSLPLPSSAPADPGHRRDLHVHSIVTLHHSAADLPPITLLLSLNGTKPDQSARLTLLHSLPFPLSSRIFTFLCPVTLPRLSGLASFFPFAVTFSFSFCFSFVTTLLSSLNSFLSLITSPFTSFFSLVILLLFSSLIFLPLATILPFSLLLSPLSILTFSLSCVTTPFSLSPLSFRVSSRVTLPLFPSFPRLPPLSPRIGHST